LNELKPAMMQSSTGVHRKSFQEVMKAKKTPLLNIESLEPEKINTYGQQDLAISPSQGGLSG
jgi:hypothetical protein